ncbi:MAG: dATP/dGTP pyrophosphohydrolase domain-containing protein [Eubacteriales bacterium]
MQHDLAAEKGWLDSRTPEHAPLSILWSIDELGEAIAIIKKKGADGIMNNESVREHFVEEVADTFMYLFDMMESYDITSDEFTRAYVKKFERNMGRSWHENDAMYEKCRRSLVIFDFTGGLPVTPRLLEVLSKTELKLAAVSASGPLADVFAAQELENDAFDLLLSGEHAAELYRLAAEHEKLSPEAIVVCTGNTDGVRAAKECGMACYAVSERPMETADKTCASLDELQDFLGFNQ